MPLVSNQLLHRLRWFSTSLYYISLSLGFGNIWSIWNIWKYRWSTKTSKYQYQRDHLVGRLTRGDWALKIKHHFFSFSQTSSSQMWAGDWVSSDIDIVHDAIYETAALSTFWRGYVLWSGSHINRRRCFFIVVTWTASISGKGPDWRPVLGFEPRPTLEQRGVWFLVRELFSGFSCSIKDRLCAGASTGGEGGVCFS